MLTLAVLVLVVAGVRVAWGGGAREARPTGVTGRGLEPDQLRARTAIVSAFGNLAPDALRVSWCESRWHPDAIGEENVGVFQVNYPAHHRPGESWAAFVRRFTVLRANVAYAFRLSSGGRDWSAWTCRP